jgi:hypothetical protein
MQPQQEAGPHESAIGLTLVKQLILPLVILCFMPWHKMMSSQEQNR